MCCLFFSGQKAYVSEKILNWHSLSLSADLCIHFHCLRRLRQASQRKLIQSSALRLTTECPTDLGTLCNSILQSLKPHISKSRTWLKILFQDLKDDTLALSKIIQQVNQN